MSTSAATGTTAIPSSVRATTIAGRSWPPSASAARTTAPGAMSRIVCDVQQIEHEIQHGLPLGVIPPGPGDECADTARLVEDCPDRAPPRRGDVGYRVAAALEDGCLTRCEIEEECAGRVSQQHLRVRASRRRRRRREV